MPRYENCIEYWLDTANNQFRGEFEHMYREIPDPWGCTTNFDSRNNRIFLELLFPNKYNKNLKNILDIGCGTGAFTNFIYDRASQFLNAPATIWGCDISETAINFAQEKYPHISFFTHDIQASTPGQPDIIIMSEVLWYVLEKLDAILQGIKSMLPQKGLLAIHQYFPQHQKYGNTICSGIESFFEITSRNALQLVDHIECIAEHEGNGLVLLATFSSL